MTGLLQIRAIDPNLGALRLDDLDLIDRLGRAFEKAERRVLSWAYFAKVLATTVSKARTRVAVLEAAGLLSHQSLRSGNVYFMTDKGQQVLRALRAVPSHAAPRHTPEALPQSEPEPTPRRSIAEPVAAPGAAKATRRFVPIPMTALMAWAGPDLGERILHLPAAARDRVGEALAEGRDLTLPEVTRAGISLFAAVELLAALAQKRVPVDAGEVPSRPEPAPRGASVGAPTPSRVEGPATSSGMVRSNSAPVSSPADRGAGHQSRHTVGQTASSGFADPRPPSPHAREVGPKAAEEGAAIAIARLALSEAQRRHPELAQAPSFAGQLLPELVWASMKGVLADYGEPLRRVRTALRLMSQKRWTTPRYMPPAFASQFAHPENGFAVC